MPLPDNPKMRWPPESWKDVYERYAEWSAWYSGDRMQLANFYSRAVFTPTPKGLFWARQEKEERRVAIHAPIAGDIAAVSADLLFAEAPGIKIPEAHEAEAPQDAKDGQERLDELVERGGIHNRLLEAAESAAAMSGVFIRPVWNREAADFPLLSVAQADAAVPEFWMGILLAVTLWRIIGEDDRGKVWRHLERYERGVILNGLYVGDKDTLGRRMDLQAHPETAGFEPAIRLPGPLADELAVRYVPNMKPNRLMRGSSLGISDLSGVEGLMDALDETFTSWNRDIRLGKGRILVPHQFLRPYYNEPGKPKFRFEYDREVYTPLDIPPRESGTSEITVEQFEVRADQHEKTALGFIERIVSSAGYSPQSFGLKIEGRAESGTALRIRERRSLTTKGKKERYFRQPVEDVLWMLLVIDREVFGRRETPIDFRPRLTISDAVTDDPKELAGTVELLSRARAASTETMIRMLHAEWGEEEVAKEVQRITEEQGQEVPDPLQVGVS